MKNITLMIFFRNLKYDRFQQKLHTVLQKIVYTLPNRRSFADWKMYKGTAYFTLHKDLVQEMVSYWNSSRDVRRHFKFVKVAEEHFYSSFAMNCGFSNTISPSGCLRYHGWTGRKGSFPDFLLDKNYEEIPFPEVFLQENSTWSPQVSWTGLMQRLMKRLDILCPL